MIVWIALDSYDSLDSCASFVLSLEQEAPFFEGLFDLKLSGSCSSLHYMRLLYTTWVFRMYIFGLNEGLWKLLKLTLHEMPLHYMAFFRGYI